MNQIAPARRERRRPTAARAGMAAGNISNQWRGERHRRRAANETRRAARSKRYNGTEEVESRRPTR